MPGSQKKLPFNEKHVPLASVETGISYASAKAKTGGYEPLVDATTALELGVRARVVAAQFIMDATFVALEQRTNRLPAEIISRSNTANKVAGSLAVTLGYDHTLLDLILSFPSLRRDLGEDDQASLRDVGGQYTTVPLFFDMAGFVLGGAHRLLTTRGADNPQATIARSDGLLAVSRLGGTHFPKLYKACGDELYMPDRCFAYDPENDALDYSEKIRRFIGNRSKNQAGCPVANVTLPDATGTVLAQSWQRMADILVPSNATSHFDG